MTGRAVKPRVGLALAGGGPLGAIYEIGALCALEEAIPALDLNALDGYVGVSAGGFVAAGLANGMTPRQLCAAFIDNTGPPHDVVHPGVFFRPAWNELLQRLAVLPAELLRAGAGYALRGQSLLSAVEGLGRSLPTGLFTQAPLQAQLRRMFAVPGRSDDFRRLAQRLVIVATDLDSGETAPFGLPGWDHVPISQAVAASAALPGLFPPLPIDGRWYVDGALKKTLHASLLLDMGLDLVLCLNPLVPFLATSHDGRPPAHRPLSAGQRAIPHLVRGGLPVVLSQMFRSLIHSRLELGMRGYVTSHPDVDILLFEPDHHDPALFLANTFDYSQRRRLAEHAYQRTRAHLRSQRSVMNRTLARHGLMLDSAVLDQPGRRLLSRQRPPRADGLRRSTAAGLAVQRLDEVLNDLQRMLEPLGKTALKPDP
jgi:predicted acylesterase/phospholipase RssA